ncbi:MAG: hypothetical protein P1U74_01790 [Legionellaceae bacterium]|nr:hypothetical protein [Legionellaceae bacterium]
MDKFKQYIIQDTIVASKFLLSACFIVYLFKMWLYSNAAWLHPELLGTAAYVWGAPDVETLPNLLRKVFDWKAFDPNVNRVRPLNDVIEVFDAILKPHLVKLIGPHPSFSFSALGLLLVAPGFLYAYLKRNLKISWIVVILCMIFISNTGFLSLFVSYIRPAKKLNMIFLCAALCFGQRHAEKGKSRDFWLFFSSILASFFSDELGLANFMICGFLFWPSIVKTKQKLMIYFTLPILFLLLTKWGLPFIYRLYSVHGAWDALNDSKKFAIFTYLFNYDFYQAALILTARSFLTTFGIYKHVFWTECFAIFVLVTLPVLQLLRYREKSLLSVISTDPFIVISILIFLVNIFDNLLDWYPFPHEISYLGSFNYYYHSNIIVLNLLWLAFLVKNAMEVLKNNLKQRTVFEVLLSVTGIIIVCSNFLLFQKVNTLVQIIHLYPFTEKELQLRLNEINYNYQKTPLKVNFLTSSDAIEKEFKATLKFIFQDRWKENGFYQTFNLIKPNPIMGNTYINHLTRAHFPCYKITNYVDNHPV